MDYFSIVKIIKETVQKLPENYNSEVRKKISQDLYSETVEKGLTKEQIEAWTEEKSPKYLEEMTGAGGGALAGAVSGKKKVFSDDEETINEVLRILAKTK